jgi:hypothetical protein
MTDIATTYHRKPEDSRETSPVTAGTNTSETKSTGQQVLITEQQVLFATAAALPLRQPKTSRRWTEAVRAITASVRAAFATSDDEARPNRRQYPPRTEFIQDSRMAREMMRL